MLQIVAVNRDLNKRVMKILIDWPEGEGFDMKSTSSGERLMTSFEFVVYVEGVSTPINIRKQLALKSTESGTLANIKRALAVSVVVLERCSLK